MRAPTSPRYILGAGRRRAFQDKTRVTAASGAKLELAGAVALAGQRLAQGPCALPGHPRLRGSRAAQAGPRLRLSCKRAEEHLRTARRAPGSFHGFSARGVRAAREHPSPPRRGPATGPRSTAHRAHPGRNEHVRAQRHAQAQDRQATQEAGRTRGRSHELRGNPGGLTAPARDRPLAGRQWARSIRP